MCKKAISIFITCDLINAVTPLNDADAAVILQKQGITAYSSGETAFNARHGKDAQKHS